MTVAVLTTVEIKPGRVGDAARLFEATNRALVSGHPDWLGAWFTGNRQTNEVTNVALWKSAASYERLRASEAFQSTMAQFGELFLGPPTVAINDVLVQMEP